MTAPVGILDRLFQTQPAGGGLLEEAVRRRANNRGLLSAGLQLLESSGPSAQPLGFGRILSRGIRAGQVGAAQTVAEADIQGLQERFGGQADPTSIASLITALAARGDPGRSVGGLSQALNALRTTAPAQRDLLEVDLGDRIAFVNPATGETVREISKGVEAEDTFTPQQDRAEFTRTVNDAFGDLQPVVKSAETVIGSWGTMLSAFDQAIGDPDRNIPPNERASFTLLQQFAKIIDPDSVVREGEIRLQTGGIGSFPTRLRNWVKQQFEGTLQPETLVEVMQLAKAVAQQKSRGLTRTRDSIISRTRARESQGGLPEGVTDIVDLALVDPFAGFSGFQGDFNPQEARDFVIGGFTSETPVVAPPTGNGVPLTVEDSEGN